jgi:hypothetical protein
MIRQTAAIYFPSVYPSHSSVLLECAAQLQSTVLSIDVTGEYLKK